MSLASTLMLDAIRGLSGLGDLAAQGPRPAPIDGAVDDDAVKPRSERTAPVKTVECSERGEEGLLRDVLGGRRVTYDQERGPVGPRPVASEQALDRFLRSALSLADQASLVPAAL